MNSLVTWMEKLGMRRRLAIVMASAIPLLVPVAALTLTLPALARQIIGPVSRERELRERPAAFLARYRSAEPMAESALATTVGCVYNSQCFILIHKGFFFQLTCGLQWF